MIATWNVHRTLDRLVDDVMRDVTGTAFGSAQARAFELPLDVRTTDDEIVLECDVPGLTQDDLEIHVEGRTLTLKGHRAYRGNADDKVWLGRRYGAFQRNFNLPELTDAEGMTASLDAGVLTLRIPKRPEAKPRRIAIGTGSGGGSMKQLGEDGS